jgi:hypothetical protein
MTFGFAASVVNGWLDTAFATPFVRLVVGDPGAAGTANGAAGDTTRQGITMAAAAGGAKAMNGTDPVWTNGGTSETITGISIFDAAVAGSFIASGTLTTSQAWATGNTFTLTSLSVSLTPVAA